MIKRRREKLPAFVVLGSVLYALLFKVLRLQRLINSNGFVKGHEAFFRQSDIAQAIGFFLNFSRDNTGRFQQDFLINYVVVIGKELKKVGQECITMFFDGWLKFRLFYIRIENILF